jgi:pyruvate ferredoxin oxidoreductase gamma subunit
MRIRFHGRGGHGVKTASRIVGTAADQVGYFCQDSSLYGAERRGAPVSAFTRISERPILERGTVTHPDLIVLADETLLNDPAAGVLQGLEAASALFINTASIGSLISQRALPVPVWFVDVTEKTRQWLGRGSSLSAGLSAAAARLCGLIPEPALLAAMREEFAALGVGADDIENNLQIARDVFAMLPQADFHPVEASTAEPLVRVSYDGVLAGTPTVLAAGNAVLRHTGTWRVERPVIDRALCTACRLCQLMCPDAAISLDERGFPTIDYDHCKGCLICGAVCPVDAIGYERETQAW